MDGLIALEDVREQFNSLRGQLFDGIELLGMPSAVEEAAKRYVRRTTHDKQSTLEALLRRDINTSSGGANARNATNQS